MIFEYHAKHNKRSRLKQFWTHENHAVEMYDDIILKSKIDYIPLNSVRAEWVKNAEDYLYSSARNISALSSTLDIDIL